MRERADGILEDEDRESVAAAVAAAAVEVETVAKGVGEGCFTRASCQSLKQNLPPPIVYTRGGGVALEIIPPLKLPLCTTLNREPRRLMDSSRKPQTCSQTCTGNYRSFALL